jgi:hypothetical protein
MIGLVLLMNHSQINLKDLAPGGIISLITLVGVLATTLSITDPVGNFIKFLIRRLGHFEHIDIHNIKDWWVKSSIEADVKKVDIGYLVRKAMSTNWISYEIDKIVSTVYFLIILCGIFVVSYSTVYQTNLLQLFTSTTNHPSNTTLATFTFSQPFNTSFTIRQPSNTTLATFTFSQPSNTTTTITDTHQLSSTTFDSNCKNDMCEPDIGSIVVLIQILLIVAILTVGVVLFFYARRLYRRIKVIMNHLYIQESIIPSLSEMSIDDDLKILEDTNQEVINYVNSQNWGMAEFLQNRLLSLIKKAIDLVDPFLARKDMRRHAGVW